MDGVYRVLKRFFICLFFVSFFPPNAFMTFSLRSGQKKKSKLGTLFMVSLFYLFVCLLHSQEYIDINCKNTNSLIPLNYTQLYWVGKLQASQKLNLNHFHKTSISYNDHSCKKSLKTVCCL